MNKVVFGLAMGFVISGSTHAALVDNGNGLIYDTVTNVTWTQDANLLGTMEARNHNLISEIIAANNGIIHDSPNSDDPTGAYVLFPANGSGEFGSAAGSSDFGSNGETDWWGAQAFANYLNSIDYKGSTQWHIPITPQPQIAGYDVTQSDLGELFYNELNGVSGRSLLTTHNDNYNLFNNIQQSYYWSGEYTGYLSSGMFFDMNLGYQSALDKRSQVFTWVVASGNVISTPIPSSIWLFGATITGFSLSKRKRQH